MKDYYFILGVKKDSNIDEIKRAYRKLSLKFHPDKNDGDDFFTERFREIQEAYEILSNTTKRQLFDNEYFTNNRHQSTNNYYNFDPIIEIFSTKKTYFEYDEPITFIWKTINANKVTIMPFGIVEPIGEKKYKFKDFKSPSKTFTIIAENTNTNRVIKKQIVLKNKTYEDLYDYFTNEIEKNNTYNNAKQKHHANSKGTNIVQLEYATNFGKITIEVTKNGNVTIPTINDKVFKNNEIAPDGKYKLGFMNYITVKNGMIKEKSVM